MESFNNTHKQTSNLDISLDKTLESAETLKNKAIDKIKIDIAEIQKRIEETDLSDDSVLISKLNITELTEHHKRINKYEEELRQVEVGEINPESILYKHSDTDEKMEMIKEKIDPNSELGVILNIKKELNQFTPEEQRVIMNYSGDLNKLFDLKNRREELEKLIKELHGNGFLEMQKNWVINNEKNLQNDLKNRLGKLFENYDNSQKDKFREITGNLRRYNDLQEWIRNGHKFIDTNSTPFEFLDQSGNKKLAYCGQVNKLYQEFKKIETENFSFD